MSSFGLLRTGKPDLGLRNGTWMTLTTIGRSRGVQFKTVLQVLLGTQDRDQRAGLEEDGRSIGDADLCDGRNSKGSQ